MRDPIPDLASEIAKRKRRDVSYLLLTDDEIRAEIEREGQEGVNGQEDGGQPPKTKHSARYKRLVQEFDRQVGVLIHKKLPECAGMTRNQFLSLCKPLKTQLTELSAQTFPESHIPFILVPREQLLPLAQKVPLMEVNGKIGYMAMDFSQMSTRAGIVIPDALLYLAVNVEDGSATRNRKPDDVVEQFKAEHRSPLTVEEGVALVIQHPDTLNDHFIDLPGSRYGDVRVASLWLNEGRPGLDWGWANYSTASWGSASCGSRIGP